MGAGQKVLDAETIVTLRFRTHQHDSGDFQLAALSVTIRFAATYARVFS
jgi:hypothetical protein